METNFTGRRNGAIDMLRGLTMFLMVIVNDFWTVRGIPHWMEHAQTTEDAMGLSDIVFPMFLFAMGLSIPYAIERRFAKGLSGESTVGHILSRTLALLLMGVFIVNSEGGFAPLLGYGKPLYWVLMVTGFFLIWNRYPEGFRYKRGLQAAGIAVLAFLALTFRTPEGGLFRSSWWGILGLIGWAYLFCSMAWLLARKRPGWLIPVWFALVALNLISTGMRDGTRLIEGRNLITDFADALRLGNGSSAIMALGGVLTAWTGLRLQDRPEHRRVVFGLGAAVVLALAGWAVHQGWIVSKNIGTLPWCLYVGAISVAAFTLLSVLDRHGKTKWFTPLRPAGTATLTVYMMPYLYYALWVVFNSPVPAWLAGGVGFLKCALFSLLCIGTAALLGKMGLKLKI